jgi:hypothetical protein
MMRYGQEQQENQASAAIAQQYGDDYDEMGKAIIARFPHRADVVGGIQTALKDGATKHLAMTVEARAKLQSRLAEVQGADATTWEPVTQDIVKEFPQLSPLFAGRPYSPELQQQIVGIGQSQDQWLDAQGKAAQSLLDGKKQEGAARLIVAADTPAKQTELQGLLAQAGWKKFLGVMPDAASAQAYLDKQAKADPEKAAKVGTFEDYVVRTYGPDPTPAQILAARKAYGQADDRAKVSVSVSGGGGAAPATIEQMAHGSGYTVDGLKKAARAYHESGQLPALGNRAATKIAIQNAEALIYGAEGDMAMTGAGFKANQGALNALTKQLGAVQAYERTSLGNLKQFTDLAKSIPDTGIPWLNTPVRALSSNLVGSTNMAAVNAARQVALTEIAKVVSNPNLTGALSDSAREEVLGLIPENATFKQIRRVAQVLEADMARRPASMQKQIADIKYEMSHPGETAPQTTVPDAPIGPYDVNAPNGKVYHFSTKAQSDTFKKSAGLQ